MQGMARVALRLGGGVFFLGTLLGLGLGCHRSAQFKKDDPGYTGQDGLAWKQSMPLPTTEKIDLMAQPKKRVVVLNFWNDTPVQQDGLGLYASEELQRGLFLTQKVMLSAETKSNLSTEDFLDGNQVKVSQLIREGRRLGVAVLVIGRVTRIVFRQRGDDVGLFRQKQSLAGVEVEMKLFDVQAGREIMATLQTGEASASALLAFEGKGLENAAYRAELVRFATREAVSKFIPYVVKSMDKLAWQGRIARISGSKIYINAGRASGIISGDILRVLNPGEEVYDPQTGAYLGRAVGQLKGTLEIVDFMGNDGAVAELHTGGNFREGDFVQLY